MSRSSRFFSYPLTFCLGLACLFVNNIPASATEISPNPYGVAGYGVLSKLGMPADCLDYDWNNLRPGNLAQMCRTNHYYEFIGIPTRYWGWNQNTNEINDPERFGEWIDDNPGRVWIISNEPDLNSQDGITMDQYVQMYKTYHDFISQRDPTAKFCIGAITGGSTTWAFEHTRNWYDYVLIMYKINYGVDMPIDIWNIHSYCGPKQIEDPDQPIRDFVTPFVNYCHTVSNGIYAGSEVWITELPIGEWMGALHEDWIIWFAQRYLPRLERAGISRWFWFVSNAGSEAEWRGVSLMQGGVSTPIGQAYSALANGFPNEVIPVPPFVPEPAPLVFADDFSGLAITDPWMVKAGQWVLEDGTLRQSRLNYGWSGETCVLQYHYGDFDLSLRMKLNASNNPLNWGGVLFRMAGRFDWHADSGYLLLMRQNGTVSLFNKHDGIMTEVPGAVSNPEEWHDFRIQAMGSKIRIWLDGTQIIYVVDSNRRFSSGYIALQVHKVDFSYSDVHLTRIMASTLEVH